MKPAVCPLDRSPSAGLLGVIRVSFLEEETLKLDFEERVRVRKWQGRVL